MISSVVDDEDNFAIDLLTNNVPADIDFDDEGDNNINPTTALIPYIQGVEEDLDECVAMCSAMRCTTAYNSSSKSSVVTTNNTTTTPHSKSLMLVLKKKE